MKTENCTEMKDARSIELKSGLEETIEDRQSGFIVPAGILIGLGTGLLMDQAIAGFLVGLGLGLLGSELLPFVRKSRVGEYPLAGEANVTLLLIGAVLVLVEDEIENAHRVDGVELEIPFLAPLGLLPDGLGNLFIGDEQIHCVRKVGPAGTITTVAGGGATAVGGGTPSARAAQTATVTSARAISTSVSLQVDAAPGVALLPVPTYTTVPSAIVSPTL